MVQTISNIIVYKAADPTAYASQVQGIRAQTTINSSIDNNTMVQTGTGIKLQDDCSNTFLSCNYFDNAAPGVFLDKVDLPPQGTNSTPTYNTWVGPYNGTLNNKFKINGPNNKLTDQGVAVFDPLYNAALSKTWHNHWIGNVGTNKVDGQYFGTQFNWMYFNNPFDAEYAPIPAIPLVFARPCSLNTSICAVPIVNDDHLRMAAYGAAVGDSSYAEYDSTEYAHSDKSTFYKAAKADSAVLYLGLPSDAIYQAEFNSLKQTDIGLFEDAKDAINNNNSSLALQKLSAMVNQNIIDENNKYMALLVALNYDASLDADSDTIVVVNNIAMMHPFYGGEAVYIARAMLHLNIIDILPPLRRQHKNLDTAKIVNAQYSLNPNPAASEVTLFSNLSFNHSKLQLYDSYGALVLNVDLPNKAHSYTIDVSKLVDGIYFTCLKSETVASQKTKLVIIKQ